jgi:dihydroorotase
MACLAHVFEEEGALDKLEGFASLFGPARYGLAPNDTIITLVKEDTPVTYPAKIETEDGPVTVFDPGHPLFWRVLDQ